MPTLPALAASLTGFILLMMSVEPAAACLCAAGPDPLSAISRYPIIFSGKVIEVVEGARSYDGQKLTAIIKVTTRWKGVVADRVTVGGYTGRESCGYSSFSVGDETTLIAYPYPNVEAGSPILGTNTCAMSAIIAADPTAKATVMTMLRRYRKEHERVDVALAAAPYSAAVLLQRAQMLERWKEPSASDAYRDLTERSPGFLPGYLGLARTLIRTGRLEAATVALEHAQALAPFDTETLQLLRSLETYSPTR